MKTAYIRFFLFLLFAGISFGGFSQVLENYNTGIREMYPETIRKSNAKIQVKLDLKTFPNSYFRLAFPGESTLFLDDKLWLQTTFDTLFVIPLDDFRNFVAESDSTGTLLTIIKTGINSSNVSVEKGFFENYQAPLEKVDVEKLLPEKREVDNFNDFFFFAIVSILFLIAVYKLIYPLVLKLILMPTSVFSAEDFSESNSVQKFFSLDVIFYLLLMNMMAFLLLMLCVKAVGNESLQFIVSGDLNQHFLSWLLGSSILILVAVLKFTLLRFLGFVFDLKKIVVPHFFYMLRIISITIFVMALIVSIIVLNDFFELAITIKYLLYGFFWIYVVGVLMLFLIMSNRVSFKNYHLFVYICSAEIVPFLILSKVIIG
ncbi:DUF4271 domain-containing protein [Aquiflexum sp. LQ15W]|uniref:DUF4271 domain-containing protein n=1 Tax=Cognataquiflexum nitidum TaxID=2922272 RepID=UPI001F147945|nr:DUF4271 domain-containing protein [Cognataquiflexum nitidum]MCH6199698.1 DUF4271 domain-containing protein [Cognataquiflexum nitidum]